MNEIMNGPRDPHGFGVEVPPTTVLQTPSGDIVIGHVEYIHGAAGRPCPEYIPTLHELEVLARHWATSLARNSLVFEMYGQTGSSEIREDDYAHSRLAAVAAHIGAERVMAAQWNLCAALLKPAIARKAVLVDQATILFAAAVFALALPLVVGASIRLLA